MIGIDRIVEGLAHTLERTVLPAVGGGYARGQLFAVLEVLGSLQGQVQWGGMLLDNEAAALAALAAEAAGLGGELGARAAQVAASTNQPLDERLREGRALLCALLDAGHADEGAPLAATIRSHLANDAIFKAMGLRPSRLAEISQG